MTSSNYTYLSADQIKMEPFGRQGRKRRASQSSMTSEYSTVSSSSGIKKLKKYEMDPTLDHTVRNARAAKANRDKKKQEELKLKEENRQYKIKVEELEKTVEKYRQREMELTEQLETEKLNSILMKPLMEDHSIKATLESIMPALNAKYGDLNVGISEESLSFPPATITTDPETMEPPTSCSPLTTDDLWQNFSFDDEDCSFLTQGLDALDDKISIPAEEIEPSLPLFDYSQSLEEQSRDPLMATTWDNPVSTHQTCHISLKERNLMVQRNTTMQCPPNLWPVLKSMALTPMGG